MYRVYIQVKKPIEDLYCLPIYESFLCVTDDYAIKVWQSTNDIGTYLRFGPITWYPVGWQK